MNPNLLLSTGIGATIMGIGGFLMQKFGVNQKILAAIKGANPQTTIAGHPKATEMLDAFESEGFGVLKDLVIAHPDILDTLEDKLAHDSVTNVGAWLATNYGPEIVADTIKRGEALLGIEAKLIFGGQKAVEEAATQRLGVAAQKGLPTLKQIITLPSGIKLVKPA